MAGIVEISSGFITFKKTAGATSEFLPPVVDYGLWYAKDLDHMKYHPAYLAKDVGGRGAEAQTSRKKCQGRSRIHPNRGKNHYGDEVLKVYEA